MKAARPIPGDLLRPIIALCLAACTVSTPTASAAQSTESTGTRRFTLTCHSLKNPRPPSPTWVVDVNLDLLTYYVDTVGGRDAIASDDGNRITFWRWGPDLDGVPMGRQEAFDRSDGHWYFSVRSDGAPTPPDGVCTTSPPREAFMADVKHTAER